MSKTKIKYGSVDTGVWKHAEFKSLDADSKLMFLYLKTCDHQNMIGCFHLPFLYMQADLSWTEKRVEETLCKLFQKGFVMVDKPLEMVFLPKHLTKHPLQNPNQAKGAEAIFNEVPKKFKYIRELAESILTQETLSKPFANRLETLCNTITITKTTTVTTTEASDEAPADAEGSDDLFEKFYGEYPKKKNRGTAEKAFKKLNPDSALVDQMILALQSLKETEDWKKQNGQFIPYPASWLNAKGWLDEISKTENYSALDDRQLVNLCVERNIYTAGKSRDQLISELEAA